MKKILFTVLAFLVYAAPSFATDVAQSAVTDGSGSVAGTWYVTGYNSTTSYRFTINSVLGLLATIPNGVTATTQTAGSNDTKPATDAYVDSSIPEIEVSTGKTITSRNGLHVPSANASWTLPPTATALALGGQQAFTQAVGQTYTMTVTPPTSSYVAAADGSAYCTISHAIKSTGAVGESIVYIPVDATHWAAYGGAAGTWACVP